MKVMTDGSASFIANEINTKRRGNIYVHVKFNQVYGKETAEKLLYLLECFSKFRWCDVQDKINSCLERMTHHVSLNQ